MHDNEQTISGEVLPVVTLHKGIPVVTSMQVAEHFEKKHFHVLRDIRRIIEETPDKEWTESNFGCTFQTIAGHKNSHRQEPYYLITREGFMILGMGFTGAKAMGMKIAFIKAYTAMEEEVRTLRAAVSAGRLASDVGLTPAAKRLSPVQKTQLMIAAAQLAKMQDRISEHLYIYAEMCNVIADGSAECALNRETAAWESVQNFVLECCEPSDNMQRKALVSALYAAYSTWCGARKEAYAPVSQKRFMELLPRHAPGARISRPRRGAEKHRPLYVTGLVLNRASVLF